MSKTKGGIVVGKEVKELEEVIDMEHVRVPQSKNTIHKKTGKGGFGIVFAKTGKRLTLNKKLNDKLGCPETLQIGMLEEGILLGKELSLEGEYYTVRQSEKNGTACIYNAELIGEIIQAYEMDFEGTSITFSEIRYYKKDGVRVALVIIPSEEGEYID